MGEVIPFARKGPEIPLVNYLNQFIEIGKRTKEAIDQEEAAFNSLMSAIASLNSTPGWRKRKFYIAEHNYYKYSYLYWLAAYKALKAGIKFDEAMVTMRNKYGIPL